MPSACTAPPAPRSSSKAAAIMKGSGHRSDNRSTCDKSASSSASVDDLQEAILQLLPRRSSEEDAAVYIDVNGPADPGRTLIRYDIPYAPGDPKRSLKLRRSLGRGAEERVVDPNVRVIIDSFITPRRWVDASTGVVWVQHASPFPSSRIDAAETQERLHAQLKVHQARRTGTSPIRSLLIAECMLEVLRQVTAECWERGLLLLHVHSERVAAQASHRRLFESRVGHAFRLALKGEKDVAKVEEDMTALKQRVELLGQEEADLRRQCSEFEQHAEEQVLIANKEHHDALTKLKREGVQKRAQLEQQLARRRKQQVAGKIGHEEYIYRLSGDPFSHQEEIHRRPQGNLDPRRVQAAGGGVGVAGARGVAGSSQPPFAVDDDANYGGGGRGGRGARLNPISGVPDAGPSNEAPALYGAPGGYIDGTPPAKKYAAANYASPYSGGGAGGYPYPFMPQVQPIISAFAPVIPAIAPVRDLPAPLPAVYRPKPPLTFHSGPTSSAEVPPLSFSPLPQHRVPPQMGDLSHDAGTPRAAAAPMYLSPGDNGARRPKTSPTVLPPLNPDAASNGGGNLFPTRSPRPSTSRATLGGGGVGGGFIIGNDGLSDVEQRQREKRAARMRAIELQQENARQMLEQQQRKQAEREREIQEDRLTEQRLQREREEVARREQAELDREKREKELKMMGPRAAQAMLEQQQRETQQRREEEAAARRNRGRAQADVAAPGTGKETPKPTISPPPTSASAAPTILPSLPPASHMMPLSAPSVLSPPVSASTLPYLVNFNLGGGLRPLPQPSPALYNYLSANACPQAAPLPNGETQAIRSELRRITNLLEQQQQQQQQQQQRRAMDSTSFGAKVAPQPWHSGVPQPSTAAGAGTYLTTGQPSPSLDAGGDAPVTSAQRNSAAPYRPFLTGGTLPPPPLTTAAPPAPSSSDAGAPPVGIGPWQGLFSSCASTSATGAGGSLLNPSCGSARQLASSITDNDPELSTEPSRFIGPFRAPMAAVPSPPVIPEPEVTVVVVESTTRKPLPASVLCAGVAETVSAHSMATTPLASEAASFRLSTAASVSASALEAFSEPEACSPARSVEAESLCSVHHISSSTAKRLRINTNEDKSERQGSASPLPKVVVAYTSSVQSLTSSQAELPRE